MGQCIRFIKTSELYLTEVLDIDHVDFDLGYDRFDRLTDTMARVGFFIPYYDNDLGYCNALPSDYVSGKLTECEAIANIDEDLKSYLSEMKILSLDGYVMITFCN